MADESLETIFGSCVLEVFTPDTSVSFPEDVAGDHWLASVKQPRAERKQAFFDEQLNLLLVMYVKHTSLNDPHGPHNPPRSLVDFLTHTQVSLEAAYIPQTQNQDIPDTISLVPPHTSSVQKGRQLHPSIFPPNTPNPIPSSTESDRKYAQSEGTFLFSSIWGTRGITEEPREKFRLLFSETQACWVAVYQLSFIVSYLRLAFPDPLLSLTASVTLRDKALSFSKSTHALVAYLAEVGMTSHLSSETVGADEDEDEEAQGIGFEEINLLEGLSLVGSSVSMDPDPLHLSSTRLGNATRQRHFSLPPVSAPHLLPPSSTKRTPHHILKKSYRKILRTVSGFRVRMRTVFIPHVLLPKGPIPGTGQDAHRDDDFEDGNEEREAGNSERTVVLCIEVENSGESGPVTGFSLERLDVKISGEDATTRLIGWGECAFNSDTENHLFPLRIGSMEQYNLLYVVSFWNTPSDQETLSLAKQGAHCSSETQRAVAITVHGRPYLQSETEDGNNILSYPTRTFPSRWNCVLDLSSRPFEEPVDEIPVAGPSALPVPPSPFPGRSALSSLMSSSAPTKPTLQAIAGKRHTHPGNITAARAVNPASNLRLSLPHREYPGGLAVPPATATSFTPPSVALQTFNQSALAAAGAPPGGGSGRSSNPSHFETFVATHTHASSPGTVVNTSHVQALRSQQGISGSSVEIKRERGMGMMAAVPQTPHPAVLNTQHDRYRQESLPGLSGEPIVVSVGLLPTESGDEHPFGQRKIFPSDQFTLDIFVYNQSSWMRRLEVSYQSVDRRQRKAEKGRRKGNLEDLKASIAPPGILPLQNRVRVGPLRQSTCQSVRMDFLAVSPGVHSVDMLTLTDVESGYVVNLRSVMDIVVHERIAEETGVKVP